MNIVHAFEGDNFFFDHYGIFEYAPKDGISHDKIVTCDSCQIMEIVDIVVTCFFNLLPEDVDVPIA